MPFDNEGIFKRVHDWQQDKANNIDINAQRLDEEDNNFANGLSQTLLRDGTVPLTGNLNANNHKITGLVNGTNNTDAITVAQLNTKQNIITGAASTVVTSNLTTNKVLVSDNNGKIKASNKSLDEIIDESNLVHKTGTETISGRKTFSADPFIRNDSPSVVGFEQDLQKGSNPSVVATSGFTYLDDSGVTASSSCFGQVGCRIDTNGTTQAYLRAFRNVTNSTEFANITVSQPVTGSPYTRCPTPTDTTSISSNQIATVGWVNSVNNNVVHKTSDETISGTKTFSSSIIKQIDSLTYNGFRIQNTQITKGTAPSSTTGGQFVFQDSTNVGNVGRLGGIETVYESDGDIVSRLMSFQPTANSTNFAQVSVIYPNSGSPYTACTPPTETNSTGSTQIATVGWVNNSNIATNIVHKDGAETISGNKTFTDDIYIKKTTPVIAFRNSNITKGSIPNSNQYWNIAMEDSSGGAQNKRLGVFETRVDTSGNTATYMLAYKNESNSINAANLSLVYPITGNPYATCPTPTDTIQTNSNQIDTVGARNTQMQSYVKNILASLYPVGSIYIGTQSTCPLATLISGSTWTKISGNKVLQSSSSSHAANTTIAAGLPNIIGSMDKVDEDMTCTGAFYLSSPGYDWNVNGERGSDRRKANFDASRVSSIYGNSSTVQPPAYVVNVWRRTA